MRRKRQVIFFVFEYRTGELNFNIRLGIAYLLNVKAICCPLQPEILFLKQNKNKDSHASTIILLKFIVLVHALMLLSESSKFFNARNQKQWEEHPLKKHLKLQKKPRDATM